MIQSWKPYQNVKPRKKSIKRNLPDVPTELQEQIRLCTWLDKNNILYYAIPNGGSRSSAIEGAKFKRSGVKSGVPDICIPIARMWRHGLYIELKRKKGGIISPTQKYWLEKLTNNGYYTVVANGADEAIQIIKDYLGLDI